MTVFVGLSGGVDSSVAAALLQQQGYRVVGVYMQNWTQDVGGVECPWKDDLADARAVAAKLDIPFEIFDFQDQYRQKVVDVMVEEYRSGRTPNPDVLCNQEIKFKLFLDAALSRGADLVATGHYARVNDGKLYTGLDALKDQSYFLYRVPQAALRHALMPIGEMAKTETRQLAKKFRLPTATKPDSQGICFVGEVGIKAFLEQYIQPQPGPVILRSSGEVLGEHDGAYFYTIGQRHGLKIGGGKPYWVTGKDMRANTVFVTTDPRDLELFTDEYEIQDCNWISQPSQEKTYKVLSRYRGPKIDCRLEKRSSGYLVRMARPERAITPGQSAVIYDGDLVIGGGIIDSPKISDPKQISLVKTANQA